jgi:hypothetical protein
VGGDSSNGFYPQSMSLVIGLKYDIQINNKNNFLLLYRYIVRHSLTVFMEESPSIGKATFSVFWVLDRKKTRSEIQNGVFKRPQF